MVTREVVFTACCEEAKLVISVLDDRESLTGCNGQLRLRDGSVSCTHLTLPTTASGVIALRDGACLSGHAGLSSSAVL